jgi:hypothetical protein
VTAACLAALLLQPDLFPAKEGHVWEYRESVTHEGKKTAASRMVVVTGRSDAGGMDCLLIEGWGGSDKAAIVVDAEGLKVVEMNGAVQKSPVLFLRFPLEAGKKWTAELALGDEVRSFSLEVFPKEAVEVPAGRFEAFPVEVRSEEMTARVWLAPDVGEVRSRYSSGRTEVIAELERFEKRVRRFHCGTCGKLSDEQKTCCGARPAPARFVRPAKVCRCELLHGKGKCKCLHCKGEKGALCYCGTGGCRCGTTKDGCGCAHCAGMDGGDDGKDGCSCGR